MNLFQDLTKAELTHKSGSYESHLINHVILNLLQDPSKAEPTHKI